MNASLPIRLVAAVNLLSSVLPVQSALAGLAALFPPAQPANMVQFSSDGHVLGFDGRGMYAATGTHALHVDFIGANRVGPRSDTPAGGQGRAAPLDRVTYENLWNGIDLTYTAGAGAIYTTTYTVAPGADPADIRLRYNAPLKLNEDGSLTIAFETGAMAESAPLAWQEIGGERVPVRVAFQLDGQEVSYRLGSYDPRHALTIDPSVVWNMFLGGAGYDVGAGIAVDDSGDVYVTGYTQGGWGSMSCPGGYDAFVTKLTPSGGLFWQTCLGGMQEDRGSGIAVDSGGNVYVTGFSVETWGAPVQPHSTGADAFAAKLNPSGGLVWNTFLGAGAYDTGSAIAVDGSGNVFVAGTSEVTWGTPVRAHSAGVNGDAFAAKLNSSGARTWNTFLGGNGLDNGRGLAADGSGNVYVTGYSDASWGSPVRAHSGGSDAIAVKLDSAGALTWSTFLGGSANDYGNSIAVDAAGNVYVAGDTSAAWGSPTRAYTANQDAFTAKTDSSGTLLGNTFLGGTGNDSGGRIVVDGNGDVYVAGSSSATWGDPIRAYAVDYDAYVAKTDSSGDLQQNTFLGGSGADYGSGFALDGSGVIFVAGGSNASWGDPIDAFSGSSDILVARVDLTPLEVVSIVRADPDPTGAASVDFTVTFSEAVTGVDAADFTLATTGVMDSSVAGVSGSGTTYTVAVGTGSGNGTIRLDIVDDDSIQDAAGNPLGDLGAGNGNYSGGEVYTIDKTAPNGPGIVWHTFLGGSDDDAGLGAAVDGDGNTYVCGTSSATWGNPDRAYSGGGDAFTAKLDPSGNLLWMTFLGGSGYDDCQAIFVDGSGDAYVTGYSQATWGNPVRPFSADDAYVAKLHTNGSLLWNTFLGTGAGDWGSGIAADGSGNVYVAGGSAATWGIPVRAYTGGYDIFAAKLNASGVRLWNTFLGGGTDDYSAVLAIDGAGHIYVGGDSDTAWGSPVRAHSGGRDAFAVELDSSGGLLWNTFLGGSGNDYAHGIAADGSGNVYLAGDSGSDWGSPVRGFTGYQDAFAAKMDTAGGLTWSTFLGGSGSTSGSGIALDGNGEIFVTGASDASWGDPLRAYDSAGDAFAARLDSSGDLLANTFLGGVGAEEGRGIALDADRNVHVAGKGTDIWGTPLRAFAGADEIFVTTLDLTPPEVGDILRADPDPTGAASVDFTLTFIESVTGVDATDFALSTTGVSGASITGVSGSGTTYTVTVGTGSGDGTIRLDVTDDDTILDAAGNPLGGPGSGNGDYTGGETYTIARVAPAAFAKLSPANASYVITSPSLSWETAVGSEEYEYCYDASNNNACDTSWVSAGTATSAVLSSLGNNIAYYWQVRASNIAGTAEADGGTWWSFTARHQTFADVPIDHSLWQYIEAFSAAGITGGCGFDPLIFCPANNVTRAAMAVFLLRAKYGSGYAPPAARHFFSDLPVAGKEWQEAWVDQFYLEGITTGCGTSPLRYCPENPVTRAAMAVFILRALEGSSYSPPAASHFFADLPVAGKEWQEPWVDELYRRGITSGCGTGPLIYCPETPVKRQAMAAFIVRAFNLPLP